MFLSLVEFHLLDAEGGGLVVSLQGAMSFHVWSSLWSTATLAAKHQATLHYNAPRQPGETFQLLYSHFSISSGISRCFLVPLLFQRPRFPSLTDTETPSRGPGGNEYGGRNQMP